MSNVLSLTSGLKKTLTILVLVAVTLVLRIPSAFAWADLGHEIVGAVAEQTIKPTTKDWLRGIMGVEPMAVSAVFPDHVRDDQRFGHQDPDPTKRDADNNDFADYHFCEIPTGFTYETAPNKSVKDCYGAINGSISLLKDTSGKVSREAQMLAVRYLVHVMGDITQPLHVGNGYDLGGNVCQIKWQHTPGGPTQQMNLHSFWDDTIVNYLGETYADPVNKIKPARYMSDFMTALNRKRPEMLTSAAKAQYSAGTLSDWLTEAQKVRESGVYPDSSTVTSSAVPGQEYKTRPYCLWFTDQKNNVLAPGSQVQQSQIPTVDTTYANQFAPIVENQLLKAGLRLAATLDQISDSVSASQAARTLTDDQQAAILKQIQDEFRH